MSPNKRLQEVVGGSERQNTGSLGKMARKKPTFSEQAFDSLQRFGVVTSAPKRNYLGAEVDATAASLNGESMDFWGDHAPD